MKVTITVNGTRMDAAPEGKIDALTAPQLEAEVTAQLKGITELNMDFSAVEYISSAGLRVLLFLQQTMQEVSGTLTVRNVSQIVMTIFEVTEFNSVINIV